MRNDFQNADGQRIVEAMIVNIQENKAYLGEIDGLIGDGDHGMNMNKGFTMTQKQLDEQNASFGESLDILGSTLFNDIGGSMGPIYGTIFMAMSEKAQGKDEIDLYVFYDMLSNALVEVQDIVEARVGDKTLIDTLSPAVDSLKISIDQNDSFADALTKMKQASKAGQESTKDLMAKYGRSSRLGERSIGVLDAGATSCDIILQAMANEMQAMLEE